METLPLASIIIGERQRSDVPLEHIESLAKEIVETELLHAVVVGPENKLVGGFCRTRAGALLAERGQRFRYNGEEVPLGHIPIIRTYSTDESTLFRLELMENLRRKSLSPMDEAKAITHLHNLQVRVHGDSWTREQTGKLADEIRGKERASNAPTIEVSDSLLLSGFADDPDVAGARTRSEAIRIANKKIEVAMRAKLGDLVAPTTSEHMRIIHGDLRLTLGDMPNESFEGIVTDPPYGIDAQDFGEQTSAEGHTYSDDKESAMALAVQILRHGIRLCRPGGHLYLFCDIRAFEYLRDMAAEAGWSPFSTPLIWHKPGLGHAPQPGYFGRRYECILFGRKGDRKLSSSHSDVFTCPAVKNKIYAAQKPVELLEEILKLSFYPGDHILDPCVGSGSLFAAAHACKMKVTGIERDAKAVSLCKELLGRLK